MSAGLWRTHAASDRVVWRGTPLPALLVVQAMARLPLPKHTWPEQAATRIPA